MSQTNTSSITVDLLPRQWEDGTGKHSAQYYPHIFGNPVPAIAGCEHCKKFRGAEETCDGWALEPQNAPLFCGPVCPRFDLLDSKRELLEQVGQNHGGCGRPASPNEILPA
jgi:hypothetical protein